MTHNVEYDAIFQDLLRFNGNKGTMCISDVADYLKYDVDHTSKILKEYKYIPGRKHRFLTITVAQAIYDHLTNKPISASDAVPLHKID